MVLRGGGRRKKGKGNGGDDLATLAADEPDVYTTRPALDLVSVEKIVSELDF